MGHVWFISTVNGCSKRKEKKPIMSCTSSGHITKLKESIFVPFDIYGETIYNPSIYAQISIVPLVSIIKGLVFKG